MKIDELKVAILNSLGKDFDLFTTRNLILLYKEDGGKQEVALEEITKFRNDFDSDTMKDNQILEILDIISGWCNERLLVW